MSQSTDARKNIVKNKNYDKVIITYLVDSIRNHNTKIHIKSPYFKF